MEHVFFFRRKSPVWGICISVFLAFVLLCLLLTVFAARSAVSLLTNMDSAVTTMMEDKTFRTKVAKSIQEYMTEDSVTTGELDQLMNDDVIVEAFGDLSASWMDNILENGTDPIDALIEAIKDPANADQYERALELSMERLDKDDQALLDGATKLAEEHGFAPPAEGSTNLEIAISVLEGTRETVDLEIEEITEYVAETQVLVQDLSFVLPAFGTALFVFFNVLLAAIFYGLFTLLLRHLLKPCVYLGIPYILVGLLLLAISSLDLASIANEFVSIPEEYSFVFDILVAPIFSSGLIALIIGGILVVGSTAGLILIKALRKKPAVAVAVAGDAPMQEEIESADAEEDVVNEEQEETEMPAEPSEEAPQAEETPNEEAPQVPVCPNCGKAVGDTPFCTGCGTRLKQ